MEHDMAIANFLMLRVVGYDDTFGLWIQTQRGCSPLIDHPRYASISERYAAVLP